MEKISLIAILLMVFATQLSAQKPSKTGSASLTIKTDYFRLHYPEGFEADAELVKSLFDQAVEVVLKEFARHRPAPLLRTANCNVHLYAEPNENASQSHAMIRLGTSDNVYFCELYFLAPSKFDPSVEVEMGHADEHFFFKTVVHEYSTVILERLNRTKKKGWHSSETPNWFREGYQDYMGVMHSDEYNRTVTLSRYIQALRDDPEIISFDYGISVKDPYVGGTLLLVFMHDTYGSRRVQSILLSEQPTFRKALRESLGDDLSAFVKKFRKWKIRNKI